MKSGVITGLSAEEYFALPAINKSGLDRVEQSPLHYWADCLDPNRPPRHETPALRLGTAIHAAILEPARFAKEYRKRPEPEDFPGCLVTLDDYKLACRQLDLPIAGTKDVLKHRIKEAGSTQRFFDEIVTEFTGFKLLTPDDLRACAGIAKSVREHPAAQTIFEAGQSELTLVWQNPETGVFCKARLDWATSDWLVVFDPKSTEDASPQAFARSCATYNYHRQAAWYLDAVEHATGVRPELFVFGAYEKSSPFASAYYHASEAMIAQGAKENRALLNKYAACLKTNSWPGYPDEFQPIDLPPWRADKGEAAAEAKPHRELETY